MKKCMFKGNLFPVFVFATALTGAMVLSSCSHGDTAYSEENVQQAKHADAVANYEKAFVSLIGQPAPNQCWDFTKGGSFTTTRGASDNTALSRWPSYSACLNGYNWKYATGGNDPLPQNILANTIKNKLPILKHSSTKLQQKVKLRTGLPLAAMFSVL